MNKVYLSGMISDEPRQVNAEGQAAHMVFTLCVRHKTSAGIVKRELYRINAWNSCAELGKARLAKGMKIALQGYLTQRVFQTGGFPVVSVEVAVDELLLPARAQTESGSEADIPAEEQVLQA